MLETPPNDYVPWESLEDTGTKVRRNILTRRAPISKARADDAKNIKEQISLLAIAV